MEMRTLVVGLVDEGALEVVGYTRLVEIDPRYETVPACDLCRAPSDRHPVVFWKYNTPVVRCTGCGLLYSNPRWKAEHLFGRYTNEYWQQYADKVKSTALDPVANEARWGPYLDTLEMARVNGRLLDVGCATGEFLVAAKARGWETQGVEPSPIAAQLAEERTGAVIYTGTLDTAPFPDRWFDVVTLWDVIEHVQSPVAYIEQAARLVRHGGMVVLTTPNIRSVAYRLLGARWWAVGPNDHIYYFSPRTMQRLLARYRLNIHAMHTDGNKLDTWQQWIPFTVLKPLAAVLCRLAQPFARRFLWGDELYVVARRV
jgi:2-polyprenyl-3-methyl-5-hydroxy-6-metoxy-1,4-benzoquinol methylase